MDKTLRESFDKRRLSMLKKNPNNDDLAIEGETIERF